VGTDTPSRDALGSTQMRTPPADRTSPVVARPGERSAAMRRVAVAAVAGWLLLSIAAIGAGDPTGVLWSGGVVAGVVAAVWCLRWPAFRRVAAAAAGAYAAVLTGATLLAGWSGVTDDARVQVLTGNPNVLAAALVTAFAAWAALATRRRWVWWGWPIVALAVLHTGSRTAGGALLAAGTVWLVVQAVRGRSRLAWAPLVAMAVLAAAAFAWQRGVVELTPNLLAAPSDFSDAAWRHDLAASVTISDEGAPGPFPGTSAQRLVATALPNRTHLVHQSIGRSEEGVPYVASIYLRADTPQRFTLTSHLASVTCDVGPEWGRCVTPVGYGDDYAQRQIHLRAPARGGSVDVEVFGAQYERGTEATPFLDARPSWVPQTMVNRFDLRRATLIPENRLPPWRAGVEVFLDQPWFGVGPSAAPATFLERTGRSMSRPVSYAHHLILQWLAVHGVIGVVGIAVLAIGVLSLLSANAWARLAPMLVALALLNTWDVTFLEPTVFVAALVAVASWAHGGTPTAPRTRSGRADHAGGPST
jgi:hypothetical protein